MARGRSGRDFHVSYFRAMRMKFLKISRRVGRIARPDVRRVPRHRKRCVAAFAGEDMWHRWSGGETKSRLVVVRRLLFQQCRHVASKFHLIPSFQAKVCPSKAQ